MNGQEFKRKLTAILSADVETYSFNRIFIGNYFSDRHFVKLEKESTR
jgi:hypothetical protein